MTIEAVVGCMFSGKTGKLLEILKQVEIDKKKFQAFKHQFDTRYSENKIVSHPGAEVEAIGINHPKEIIAKIDDDTQVVVIDEVQFFTEEIVDIIDYLADKGLRVVVAGLDLDFRGEPFGSVPSILAKAEQISKLTAICEICKNKANRSQRIINGKPASYFDDTVVVGAQEKYEARCREHHEVPDKPGYL